MSDKPATSLKVEVPGFDASEIARQAIAEKLAESMLGQDAHIRQIVIAALAHKVDSRGQVSQYSYDNKIPFLEWMAQDLVRAATLDVLKAKVEKLRPAIEKEVERQLLASAKTVSKLVADHFLSQAKSGYGVNINVSIRERD